MNQVGIYVLLFAVIVAVGIVFRKSTVPTALLLVMAGMVIGEIPNFPRIELAPKLVLDIFLPLLIYKISVFSSWRDVKKNLIPISLLSIGHVIFITVLVAVTIHTVIPDLGWPLAFVLGAVVSPPDDIAIISIAEKIKMPRRIVTVLKGEGMFNDAMALILFRFSLAAVISHTFVVSNALSAFVLVLVGETLYGLLVGYVLGNLRIRVKDPILQMMFSFLTPFVAYLPAEHLGGSGVLSTVVTGLVIDTVFIEKFSPEVRLLGRSVWETIGYALESILFLLVGLEISSIHASIVSIPITRLFWYSMIIIMAVILGRFLWVFPTAYLSRFLFPAYRKKDPYPPWQYVFVESWAGMRGGISLAAALAIPFLPLTSQGENPRDLLIYLVFSVIFATLILQGLALPWVLKVLKIPCYGQRESHLEHLSELSARLAIAKGVIKWLKEYSVEVQDDPDLLHEVKFRTKEYKIIKKSLQDKINKHNGNTFEHNEALELRDIIFLTSQIVQVERKTMLQLWHKEKISHELRNKMLIQLDHREKHLS